MSEVVICWPWGLRLPGDDDPHPEGRRCADCSRDVAAPPRDPRSAICLYCAIGRGLIWDERPLSFGLEIPPDPPVTKRPGTSDMTRRAREAGVEVVEVG